MALEPQDFGMRLLRLDRDLRGKIGQLVMQVTIKVADRPLSPETLEYYTIFAPHSIRMGELTDERLAYPSGYRAHLPARSYCTVAEMSAPSGTNLHRPEYAVADCLKGPMPPVWHPFVVNRRLSSRNREKGHSFVDQLRGDSLNFDPLDPGCMFVLLIGDKEINDWLSLVWSTSFYCYLNQTSLLFAEALLNLRGKLELKKYPVLEHGLKQAIASNERTRLPKLDAFIREIKASSLARAGQ